MMSGGGFILQLVLVTFVVFIEGKRYGLPSANLHMYKDKTELREKRSISVINRENFSGISDSTGQDDLANVRQKRSVSNTPQKENITHVVSFDGYR